MGLLIFLLILPVLFQILLWGARIGRYDWRTLFLREESLPAKSSACHLSDHYNCHPESPLYGPLGRERGVGARSKLDQITKRYN